MISRHDMLNVSDRAMHNPRAAWFAVRPLHAKPALFPFRTDDGEAVPAIVAQFAVEHPTDVESRRVITIAATPDGYAVWCGDKYTQGDVSALDASLRVELAISELPAAYVEGARAAMMSIYGSYPLRKPCHFWHAWHKDQGVCKHVAAALQFVARTHPDGVEGLLDELDDTMNSLTTAPLVDLLDAAEQPVRALPNIAVGRILQKMPAAAATSAAAASEPGSGSPTQHQPAKSLAELLGLDKFRHDDAPLTLLHRIHRAARDANAPSASANGNAHGSATSETARAKADTTAGEGEGWSEALRNLMMQNPAIKTFFIASEDLFGDSSKAAAQNEAPATESKKEQPFDVASFVEKIETLQRRGLFGGPAFPFPRKTRDEAPAGAAPATPAAEPAAAKAESPASTTSVNNLITALVNGISAHLQQEFMATAGMEDNHGNALAWNLRRIAETNHQLRSHPDAKSFDDLIFFADTAREDGMFALRRDADGIVRRPDIYRFDCATRKTDWFAEELAMYLRRRVSEG